MPSFYFILSRPLVTKSTKLSLFNSLSKKKGPIHIFSTP
jgi:hypothetical protein